MDRRAVVLLSGGIDSSTLLFLAKKRLADEVLGLSIDYGQRHKRELEAAEQVAKAAGVSWHALRLASKDLCTAFGNPALLDGAQPIPHGNYADVSMRSTVVPNRNMFLLSLAGAFAISLGAGFVCYAAHGGDHPIYADCRPGFIRGMEAAFKELDVTLWTPFMTMDKRQIVKLGKELAVPYDLTWSCYKGYAVHCGKCGTCVERKEAFELAGLGDPTIYEA